MKQVIVIHGGTTFENYEDYIADLATKPLKLDRYLYKPMWKERLAEDLGEDYQVLLPTMPNKQNARYSEWRAFFTNFTQLIEDDCILVGHSLGAIFLAQYLSEVDFPCRIKATILIAGPYDDDSTEDLTDFKLKDISPRIIYQAGKMTFFFGTDDPIVPLAEAEKYRQKLPNAEYILLPAPDHFMREEFPELLQVITKS